MSSVDSLQVRSIVGGYKDTTVIRELSLNLEPSSVVAVLGPNGAGKSTLLRMVIGLIRPSSGSIVFEGQDVTSVPADERAKRGMCLIPEGKGIFPSLTVRENMTLHVGKGSEADGISQSLEVFPALRNRLDERAGHLSGGEQQMLALSRAYTCNPKIVLIDEASIGLAPMVVDEIFAFLKLLRSRGVSLIIVEQFVSKAIAIADYVYVLNHGSVVLEGPASGVDAEMLTERYFGSGGGPAVPANGVAGGTRRRRS